MLNRIAWNITVFTVNCIEAKKKFYLHQTELFKIELFWHLTVYKQKLYLRQTELLEIKMF